MNKGEIERLDDQGMASWDSHDPQAFVDQFADEFVVNDVASPEPITTKEGVRAYAQAWFTAFPDMSIKQMNRVVGEDSVAAEVQFTGTNTGPMMMAGKEIPPTGKSVVGKGTYFARAKDGKVTEFNSYPDIAGMMMQLGFMPPM
ncbi:MAG: ester cyclase [Actinomycetota bacterium]